MSNKDRTETKAVIGGVGCLVLVILFFALPLLGYLIFGWTSSGDSSSPDLGPGPAPCELNVTC